MTGRRANARYTRARVGAALRRRRLEIQRSLRFRRAQGRPLREAVLFESFAGRVVGDNPLAMHRELASRGTSVEVLWTVARRDMAVPEGARAVVHGSAPWLDAVATCRYLVNNTSFPAYFRKRPEQVYCQTWHGTPLKRLAHDMPPGSISAAYLAMYDREAAAWDFLLAANAFSAEVLTRAFRYSGPVLGVGYPRNDRLVTVTPAERQAIRERLGVPDPAERLLLYGPTWRDDRRTAGGQFAPVNHLTSGGPLPEGWRLAFRGHSHTHGAHDPGIAQGALDVTTYPDVTDLLIAADALLTDYSSLMFDFTVTGRPVLFLAPDIAQYRSSRGFYLDFEAEAPGPVLSTPQQAMEALAQLPAVIEQHAARYAAWQARFNAWEDGQASRRAVDAVFGTAGRGSAPQGPQA